ncbi:hypothetical protein [Bradyrhizobium sp. CCBAU 21359]|nr:hypothetical protein [Bradyrhizobium sp. CCBAU 21359]
MATTIFGELGLAQLVIVLDAGATDLKCASFARSGGSIELMSGFQPAD